MAGSSIHFLISLAVVVSLTDLRVSAILIDEITSTRQGTAFVISMMRNVWVDDPVNSTHMRIFIVNPSTRKLHLHMEVASVISYSATLEPKMMRQIKVTSKMRHEGNGVFSALHIASSENVSVLVINNGLSRDGYLAIPIEAFGITYTVVTLVGQPVFHVLSTADDTDVVIHFNDWSTLETISSEEFNLMYGKKIITPGSTLTVSIKKRYQYFQFQDCEANRYTRSDFTGTRVLSVSPIGVVSGNCETSSKGEYHFRSHVEEMLFPMTNWGYHYYFLTPESTADTRLRILSHAAGQIKLLANGTQDIIALTENDTYVERFVESGTQILMSSDTPICVVMFSTEVTDHQSGDLSMVQVIPNENWLNWYYISVPTVRNKKLTVIMTVLLLTKDLPGLHIDFSSGLPTNTGNRSRVTTRVDTLRGYTALTRQLDDTSIHVVYHVDGRKFGCYVKMMMSPGHVYVPAGSMLRNVERYRSQCLKSQWYVVGEDLMDNDCDGFVDEEKLNNEDDDFDEKVDEDLGVVNGSWSAWSVDPFCSVPCRRTMGNMGYFRTCTDPEPSMSGLQCDGQDFKPLEGPEQKCNTADVKCPEECPNTTWYYGCVNKCPEGCLDPCNRLTGRCRVCKPGFPMSEDRKCNLDFSALSADGNETVVPDEGQPPHQGGGANVAQGETSSIPHLGWKIYATIIYVGAIVILGVVYEVYKRYKK